MIFSKKLESNKITVDVSPSMSIPELATKLQTYGFTHIIDSNCIWYKKQSLRIMLNNNKITFNKFSDCFQYEVVDTSTIFPSGKLIIDLNLLDLHIAKLEESINNGEMVKKEAEFKLQLFLPYIQQKILDVYPYVDEITIGTKTKDDSKIMYTIRSSLYSFGLVLNKKPYKFIVDNDFDDYVLESDILFSGIPLTIKRGTVLQWISCLPTIFEQFKIISDEINTLDKLKKSLTAEANEKVKELNEQIDTIKSNLKEDVSKQCKLSYTTVTMNEFVNNLF